MLYQTKIQTVNALQWIGNNLAEMTTFIQGLLGTGAAVTPTLRNRVIIEGLEIAVGQFVVVHGDETLTALDSAVFFDTYEPA